MTCALYPYPRRKGRAENRGMRLLAEIYNWFTEGFDTKDLQEVKVLKVLLEERS
jgi:hypothetical protein